MQRNFPPHNKSYLMRVTDQQKKKARNRLIGSIVLLLISLIILLNVTSKIHTIKRVNVKITMKNNESAIMPITNNYINTTKNVSNNESLQQAQLAITNQAPVNDDSNIKHQSSSVKITPQHIANNIITPSLNNNESNTSIHLQPKLLTTNINAKLSPQDILNNTTPHKITIYSIAVFSDKDKNKVAAVQNWLINHGLESHLSVIRYRTNNAIMYRIIAGRFANKQIALDTLSNIANNFANVNL
jgi:hypothetical protein